MARHWRERLDATRHTDWMSTTGAGGRQAEAPRDPLIESWVYLVEVSGVRLEFVSLDQVRECLAYFSESRNAPTRLPDANPHEHYWQRWFERLPPGLLAEPKRSKVLAALERALADFDGTRNRD